MRPGCVFACIDHVIYMDRQMDEQTGEMTKYVVMEAFETCWLIICFSKGSHRGQ